MVEDSFPAEDSQEADREWEEAGTKYMIRKAHPQWATSFSYAPPFLPPGTPFKRTSLLIRLQLPQSNPTISLTKELFWRVPQI